MNATSSIGLSGLRAAEARATAPASNIASPPTSRQIPGVAPAGGAIVRPAADVAAEVASKGQSRAVTYASYIVRPNAFTIIYDPGSPEADVNGIVTLPNVEISNEPVSAFVAKYQFLTSARPPKPEGEQPKPTVEKVA